MAQIVPTSAGGNLPGWVRSVADTVNWLVKKRLNERTITAGTTLDDGYEVVLCDATSAALTVALPPAALYSGKLYYLKKIDSSAHAVTIDGNGAETIDGAATQSLANQYQTITVFSNGTGWYIVPVSPVGGATVVTNAATFNNSGSGDASGATFNGSAAVTISYNTIGAQVAGSYLSGNQTITLSGDVTGSGATAITTAIANGAVTNAILAQVSTATFKGRTTAGTGNVEDLTATQATALLNALVGDSGSGGTKGLAPAPGSGDAAAGKFLKADATWAVPSGGGGGSGVSRLTSISSATGTPNNTTETDLLIYTLPAGTLASNGQAVRIKAAGTLAATTRSRTVRLYFGTTVISTVTTASSSNIVWQIEATVIRVGATSQMVNALVTLGTSNSTSAILTNSSSTETLSGSLSMKITGQVAGSPVANDIVGNFYVAEFLP